MTTLERLTELSMNMWWSWNPDALDLFRELNQEAFQAAQNNPRLALNAAMEPAKNVRVDATENVTATAIAEQGIPGTGEYSDRVHVIYDRFRSYMDAESSPRSEPSTAYFCMEFGLHESLPLYSGGLGILAGDHLKAASDAAVPLTAVGLLHREGYFRQFFDQALNQQVTHTTLNPDQQPLSRVVDPSGRPLIIEIPLAQDSIFVQAWKVGVGRVELYLLDPDIPENTDEIRNLCHRLYQGDQRDRIRQEIILGIGGIRLLRALNLAFDVFHMNEGHCAFLSLELLREQGTPGLQKIRKKCVFTTHTPVRAGHDRFTPILFKEELSGFVEMLPLSMEETLALGRVNPDDPDELFTMTVLGLKLSRSANAVSRLNGDVSRRQWEDLYPDTKEDEIPIGYITNGVHLPTWANKNARTFLDSHLAGWNDPLASKAAFTRASELNPETVWKYRCSLRAELIEFVRNRSALQSFHQEIDLNPEALTIGFARRFATYKRAPLFFHDLEQARSILRNTDRPVQIVYAGKAHPADKPGQEFIRQILEFSRHDDFRGKVVFLEDYDMEIGRMLISGCDVWLNNPRRPKEACGTSGQKITIHGGLNLSILDGWWAEGFNEMNGWAIDRPGGPAEGFEYNSEELQDMEDAAALYARLTGDVIPLFYTRDETGIPAEWVGRIQHAITTLAFRFSAARMMQDYVGELYSTSEPRPLITS